MRKILWICGIVLIVFSLACPSKDYEVTIKLTNPDDQNVAFIGFYKVQSSGDSVWMQGDTPKEYTFMADGGGDRVEGIISKGSADSLELRFQLLVDDEEKMSQSTSSITQAIQFFLDISK